MPKQHTMKIILKLLKPGTEGHPTIKIGQIGPLVGFKGGFPFFKVMKII